MSDSSLAAPTEGAYRDRISRALWFRAPGKPGRFLFTPGGAEGLCLFALDPAGAQAFSNALRGAIADGQKPIAGAWLVDEDGDIVFCLDADPAGFLAALAGWARNNVAAIPALTNLRTAAAARVRLTLGDAAAVAALTPDALTLVRDPGLFAGVLGADTLSVAAVLDAAMPGERHWFWLSDQVDADMPPLLLQPVAWDPNRDRLDGQIAELEARGAGDGVTGFGLFDAEGRLQLVGRGMVASYLTELADWVGQEGDAFPALRRLAHCRLVESRGGEVERVIEDPALWAAIAPPPAPGTLAGAASLLASLPPGGALRAWMTRQAPGGAFLAFWETATDSDGQRFGNGVAGLYRRFAQSFADAVTGTLRRDAGGGLTLACDSGDPTGVKDLFRRLAALEPGLAPLVEADIATA